MMNTADLCGRQCPPSPCCCLSPPFFPVSPLALPPSHLYGLFIGSPRGATGKFGHADFRCLAYCRPVTIPPAKRLLAPLQRVGFNTADRLTVLFRFSSAR